MTAPLRPSNTDFARRRAEMIRVDHAGERGAVAIYAGQRAIFGRAGATQSIAAKTAAMSTSATAFALVRMSEQSAVA